MYTVEVRKRTVNGVDILMQTLIYEEFEDLNVLALKDYLADQKKSNNEKETMEKNEQEMWE